MKLASTAALGLAMALAAPARAGDEAKAKKPALALRVVPRMAFSPVTALFTAELSGGDDVEDLYCPEIEWDWDDGGKSDQESDCPPFEPGKTKIERHFTAEHEYPKAGVYSVKVTLRHAKRSLAAQTVKLTVRPGLGDPSREGN